ncbi:MAG: ABC transporter ATP-binding protein [Candidatus Hadarchaeum sp.]
MIGPSGCGKSTLARLVAGLEDATEGTLLLDGQPIRRTGPDRGMVFQNYSLFPWLTVLENVMFGILNKGVGRIEAEHQAVQWIDLVGLSDYARYYPHQLSGGMKQRVAIARALAVQPKILLMDEPFGALDAQTRARMQSYLLEIWKKIDITILFITHDLDEAVFLADRILVLKPRPGEIVEFLENPVPVPRSFAQLTEPVFQAARQRLHDLIHPSTELVEEPFQMIRLTPVGDDVL